MKMFAALKKSVEKIHVLKRNVLNKTPKEKNRYIQQWGTFFLGKLGCAVTDPKFKIYWYSFCPLYILCNYIGLATYTIAYYIQHEEYMKCFQTLSVLGVAVPVRN